MRIQAVSFADAQQGWIVTNELDAAGEMQYTLIRTQDGGSSWQRIPLSFQADALSSQDHLLGGIQTLAMATPETGWARYLLGTCTAEKSNGDIQCSSDTKLLRTADGGISWNALNLPIDLQQTFTVSGAESPENSDSHAVGRVKTWIGLTSSNQSDTIIYNDQTPTTLIGPDALVELLLPPSTTRGLKKSLKHQRGHLNASVPSALLIALILHIPHSNRNHQRIDFCSFLSGEKSLYILLDKEHHFLQRKSLSENYSQNFIQVAEKQYIQ